MKFNLLVIVALALITACSTGTKKAPENVTNVVFQPEDKEILQQVRDILGDEKDAPTAVVMVKVGTFFKETPYVAHTLETEPEQLVVNLREMDCTTFAEYCLAISKTIKSDAPSFETFAKELQKIRYRNGEIDGYTSRLHYFSDWIDDNAKKKLVKPVSKAIANTPFVKEIDFMSTHPDSYGQLKNDSSLIATIAEQERQITRRESWYVPEEKIAEAEEQLMDGDIVGITTGIGGLDIQHVGILIRKSGRIHLMHASSAAGKVIVSEETLEEYLMNSKTATGIMVARPL